MCFVLALLNSFRSIGRSDFSSLTCAESRALSTVAIAKAQAPSKLAHFAQSENTGYSKWIGAAGALILPAAGLRNVVFASFFKRSRWTKILNHFMI